MKRRFFLPAAAAAVLSLSACSTTGVRIVDTTINEQDISIASLNRSDYQILGKVRGEGTIIAPDKQIERERSGIRPVKPLVMKNDTYRYGYTGTNVPGIMTVKETAVANALYQMIRQAEANGADAVAFVSTEVSVVPYKNKSGMKKLMSSESTVTAMVTGIAIKIKTEKTEMLPAPAEEPEQSEEAVITPAAADTAVTPTVLPAEEGQESEP